MDEAFSTQFQAPSDLLTDTFDGIKVMMSILLARWLGNSRVITSVERSNRVDVTSYRKKVLGFFYIYILCVYISLPFSIVSVECYRLLLFSLSFTCNKLYKMIMDRKVLLSLE